MVSVAPLRAEFTRQRLRGNTSARGLAKDLGWLCPTKHPPARRPDAGRVLATLGLRPYNPGHGQQPRYRDMVTEATAEALASALHLDPWEVGL